MLFANNAYLSTIDQILWQQTSFHSYIHNWWFALRAISANKNFHRFWFAWMQHRADAVMGLLSIVNVWCYWSLKSQDKLVVFLIPVSIEWNCWTRVTMKRRKVKFKLKINNEKWTKARSYTLLTPSKQSFEVKFSSFSSMHWISTLLPIDFRLDTEMLAHFLRCIALSLLLNVR